MIQGLDKCLIKNYFPLIADLRTPSCLHPGLANAVSSTFERNCRRPLKASLYMSTCPNRRTRLPMHGFTWNRMSDGSNRRPTLSLCIYDNISSCTRWVQEIRQNQRRQTFGRLRNNANVICFGQKLKKEWIDNFKCGSRNYNVSVYFCIRKYDYTVWSQMDAVCWCMK